MAAAKIKKGDRVVVLSGKDKGKTGDVTKAMPKEMLPVVDRPAIEYVVTEARRAGLADVLMITGRNKRALEDHFDRHPALEAALIHALAGDPDAPRLGAAARQTIVDGYDLKRQSLPRLIDWVEGFAP